MTAIFTNDVFAALDAVSQDTPLLAAIDIVEEKAENHDVAECVMSVENVGALRNDVATTFCASVGEVTQGQQVTVTDQGISLLVSWGDDKQGAMFRQPAELSFDQADAVVDQLDMILAQSGLEMTKAQLSNVRALAFDRAKHLVAMANHLLLVHAHAEELLTRHEPVKPVGPALCHDGNVTYVMAWANG